MPVTSCSAERSFSCLRRIKSYTRNTMGQDRLSSLAICSIERDIAIGIDKSDIIDKFGKMYKRENAFF